MSRSQQPRILDVGRLTLRRSALPSDAGFTLIEAVASLAIATLILTGLAFATIGSLRGSATARINQQAGDVLESAIEAARDQAYDDLVMYTGDSTLATDSRILHSGCPSGGTMCVSVPNPTGSGSTTENLVTSTAIGFQSSHIQTQTTGTNKVSFTVATYVTKPADDSSASYRRVTVFVSWTNYGKTHTREGSSYVAETQRGLPLPKFTLTCVDSGCAQTALPNLPYNAEFEFTLVNSGARDSFDFTQTGTSLVWTFYKDDGSNDPPQTGLDTQLTDSSGDAVPDTGLLDTDGQISIWAVASNVPVGNYTPTFTATSDSQPTLSTAKQSQAATLVVSTVNPSPSTSTSASSSTSPSPSPSSSTSSSASTSPSSSASTTPSNCTGIKGDSSTSGSGYQYYLHNTATSDLASAAQYPMAFNTGTASTTTDMPDFSNTDGKGSQIGRNLSVSTPSINATTASSVASWQFTVTSNRQPGVSGTVVMHVWAEVDPVNPPSNNQVQLQAMVGYKASGSKTFTEEDSNTGGRAVSAGGCSSWEEFAIAIPVKSFTTKKGGVVEVSLFNVGSSDVRIGYAANTSNTPFPADVWFTINPGTFSG